MGQNPGSGKYHIELTQTFKMRPKDFSARDDGGKFDFNKTPLALPVTMKNTTEGAYGSITGYKSGT